jgi:hypothetical protein
MTSYPGGNITLMYPPQVDPIEIARAVHAVSDKITVWVAQIVAEGDERPTEVKVTESVAEHPGRGEYDPSRPAGPWAYDSERKWHLAEAPGQGERHRMIDRGLQVTRKSPGHVS